MSASRRSRMLLKGDEGGAKFGGGDRKWRFSPGGSLPLGHILAFTSNRDSSFFLGRRLDQFREKVQSLQADTGLYAVRSRPVIVGWSTAPRG
jgi:hypothetical protein